MLSYVAHNDRVKPLIGARKGRALDLKGIVATS
jgi:hypothetical protein